MRLASWDAAAAHLATRFPWDRRGEEHGTVAVTTSEGEVGLEVRVRTWGDTRWLCIGGVVGPARHADPASLVAANGDRVLGAFEVTREGEVWLRHALLLEEVRAVELDAVVEALAAEISRLRGRRA